MNTTENLGEAVGIRWRGTEDRTETPQLNGLNLPVLIGRFRRGRTDKPMLIKKSNIKSKLGYAPNNPDYIAVQSCLDVKGVSELLVINLVRART